MLPKPVIALGSLAIGAACLAAALFYALPSEPELVSAADHTDSPLPTANGQLDITDVYAFRPTGTDDLCVAVCVAPQSGSPVGNVFSNDGYINLYVDNTGDTSPEATVKIEFSGTSPQMWTITGLTGTPITGQVTTNPASPSLYNSGGIQVFAGMREDPFFFDLVGFQSFSAAPYTPTSGLRNGTTPADTFAGLNVAAVVIQLPIVAVNGVPTDPDMGTIKAWVKTFRNN